MVENIKLEKLLQFKKNLSKCVNVKHKEYQNKELILSNTSIKKTIGFITSGKATIIKTELVPTLQNINKSVAIVSGIIIKADEGVNRVKEIIKNSPLRILTKLSAVTGTISKGFFSGISTAFKYFSKKK